MRNFHLLMCSLAVYDFFHLILDIVCFALAELNVAYKETVLVHGIPYLIPITQVGREKHALFIDKSWENRVLKLFGEVVPIRVMKSFTKSAPQL